MTCTWIPTLDGLKRLYKLIAFFHSCLDPKMSTSDIVPIFDSRFRMVIILYLPSYCVALTLQYLSVAFVFLVHVVYHA